MTIADDRPSWVAHYYDVVEPAWQEYLEAEQALTAAAGTELAPRARADAFRRGGSAAFFLHHFVEIVLQDAPDLYPASVIDESERNRPNAAREWLEKLEDTHPNLPIPDVRLLGDVVDALKHARLQNSKREVVDRKAVLIAGTGWGELGRGEGKWGGAEQILIVGKNRTRPLLEVLDQVMAIWAGIIEAAYPGDNLNDASTSDA